MDPITLGLGAVSIGSSLFGSLFNRSGKVDSRMSQAYNLLDIQNSQLEQQQMNLDANRRKRDIIRQAQVATANAEAAASSSGALKSSGVEGARATISGQEGVNYLGVSQNQEIGNQLFNNKRMQALLGYQMKSQSTRTTSPLSMVGDVLGSKSDEIGRLLNWGMSL